MCRVTMSYAGCTGDEMDCDGSGYTPNRVKEGKIRSNDGRGMPRQRNGLRVVSVNYE